MGWVPPRMPEKPDWMSKEDYRELVGQEIVMLRRLSKENQKFGRFNTMLMCLFFFVLFLLSLFLGSVLERLE